MQPALRGLNDPELMSGIYLLAETPPLMLTLRLLVLYVKHNLVRRWKRKQLIFYLCSGWIWIKTQARTIIDCFISLFCVCTTRRQPVTLIWSAVVPFFHTLIVFIISVDCLLFLMIVPPLKTSRSSWQTFLGVTVVRSLWSRFSLRNEEMGNKLRERSFLRSYSDGW